MGRLAIAKLFAGNACHHFQDSGMTTVAAEAFVTRQIGAERAARGIHAVTTGAGGSFIANSRRGLVSLTRYTLPTAAWRDFVRADPGA